MAANTLNILAPEREQPDGADLRPRRGARLRGGRRLGQDHGARVPGQGPRAPDADARGAGLPRGSLWESCAIMAYLCNKHGLDEFYPTDPGERAMIDSAMFYLIGDALSGARRARPTRRSASRSTRARSRRRRRRTSSRPRPSATRRRRWPSRSTSTAPASSTASGSSAATARRSPTAASRPRSSSCASIDYPFPDWAGAVHGRHGGDARRGLFRAGGRRPRLHRLGQGRDSLVFGP